MPNRRKNKVNRAIPHIKRSRSYPAVLIGRLGVNKDYKRKGIGVELMDFIKSWFIDLENKTGCRYVVVDSYNEPIALNYYTSNGFEYLFPEEAQEKVHYGISSVVLLKTRLMYFDLIVLSNI